MGITVLVPKYSFSSVRLHYLWIFLFYFIYLFCRFRKLEEISCFLRQAISNKTPKDTISYWFFAKFSIMCRHNTGSFHESVAFFYAWMIHRSVLMALQRKKLSGSRTLLQIGEKEKKTFRNPDDLSLKTNFKNL